MQQLNSIREDIFLRLGLLKQFNEFTNVTNFLMYFFHIPSFLEALPSMCDVSHRLSKKGCQKTMSQGLVRIRI